ncbi:hypothetical protein HanIR_Chr07g0310821 [Helianthus annuus]|nr:hypothetical protein HanIR_Chr07g0310821 [Helianthus annuus]
MCLLVTFMPFMFSYHMLIMFISTLSYMISLHFMLCMSIVCILSTSFYITFHAMYVHCVHT